CSFQPDNQPGNCWPFPGSQGHVFIKLSEVVFPVAVRIHHGIAETAYWVDSISCAPKDFAVYVSDSSRLWGFCGLKEEDDVEETFLGEFTFTPGQTLSQTFLLK
ncbi:SUN3 protein, partial [Odontophorus gujanensis]|nr:SUN3 protein [Odontophorus gujanensis]